MTGIRNVVGTRIFSSVLIVWVGLAIGCGGKKFELSEAEQALIDARTAIAEGDSTKAIEFLDISIEANPDTWSFYERAKLHAENGDDEAAKADIAAGLELEPEHSELLWLQKQLKKSKSSRFKGSKGQPPSVSK